MRLTCPRCGAQYEIDDAAIPAVGRDVECSACSHVWHAAPPAPAAAPFDAADRPPLSRPLNESILSVLREEAARELQARQAESPARPPRPAPPPAPPPASGTPTPTPTAAAAGDWPATTLTYPAPRMSADILAQRMERDFAEIQRDADAATDGAADDASPDDAAKNNAPPAETAPSATADRPTEIAGADPAAAAPAAPEAVPQPDADDADRSPPPPLSPPSAQPLGPPSPQTSPQTSPLSPPRAARPLPTAAGPVTAASGHPAQRKAGRGRGAYNAGFNLAFMAALVLLALYALAPRLADQGDLGARLMEFRAQADQGRDWLQTHADGLVAGLRR